MIKENVMNFREKIDKKLFRLQMRKKLPHIILPKDKIDMFIEWWNKDLRYQNTIPIAFNEGYFSMDNTLVSEVDFNDENLKEMIKKMAKHKGTTYRKIEDDMREGFNIQKKVTVYFKFIDNTILDIYIYFTNNLVSHGKIDITVIDDTRPNYDIKKIGWDSSNEINKLFLYIFYLFATSMWYISTTTKQTKYIYKKREYNEEKSCKEDGNIINVKAKRIVETPFYDFSKIRYVEVDKLVQRRKGWTYSHSFTVCGHYRHYKNGKTIFVNSFVKGKNKPLKAQEIIISPKE